MVDVSIIPEFLSRYPKNGMIVHGYCQIIQLSSVRVGRIETGATRPSASRRTAATSMTLSIHRLKKLRSPPFSPPTVRQKKKAAKYAAVVYTEKTYK